MATSPLITSTVDELKQQLAVYEDIVNMMNSGKSGLEIANKYGFYPDSTKIAVNNINAIKAELVNRGETVEGLPNQEYDTKKNIIVVAAVILLAVIIIGFIGKIKS